MDSGFGTCLDTRSQEDLYIHICLVSIHEDLKIRGFSRVVLATFYGQVLSISQIIPKSHAAINTTYNTIYATALHTSKTHTI